MKVARDVPPHGPIEPPREGLRGERSVGLGLAPLLLLVPQGFEPAEPRLQPELVRFAELRAMVPLVEDAHIALGDLDGDLDLDLVYFDRHGGGTLVNLGHGVLRNGPRPGLPEIADLSYPLDLALGDLDGDADLDLVACITNYGFHVATNDGAGRFTTVASPALDGLAARRFALGDADGDGLPDLFLADRLFRGLGTGHFAEVPGAVPPVPAAVSDVELGDLDGDGDVDAFLAVNSGTAGNVLLLRDVDGSYVDASSQVPGPARWARDAALGDVDGDGDLDVLVANNYAPGTHEPERNQLLRNDGAGSFTDSDLGVEGSFSTAAVLLDVEGDGDLDVVFGNSSHVEPDPWGNPYVASGGWNSLLVNDGAGVFTHSSAMDPYLNEPATLAAGDVDRDGDVDLVTSGNRLRLLLGDGAGALCLDRPGSVPVFRERFAFADLNADGHVDIAGRRLFLGDGAGGFAERDFPLTDATAVALGDVDADGDLDYLGVAGAPPEPEIFRQDHCLFLNDGTGSFSDASDRLPGHWGEDRGVGLDGILVDVDRDGDLDVAIGEMDDYDGGGGGVTLYTNDGTGYFSDASDQIPGPGQLVARIKAGDVDADGDPDLVILGNVYHPGSGNYVGLHLLRNDGAGFFAAVQGALPAFEGSAYSMDPSWLDVGDVERDGDLDVGGGWRLTYPYEDTQFNCFARNDGAGGFGDVAVLSQDSGHYDFADVDTDGDLEIVSPLVLLELGPNGYRRRADWRPPMAGLADLVFCDIDHDGDLDAYPDPGPRPDPGPGDVVFWSNLTRQLARSGTPGIGKPLHLELYGPPEEPWLLARSMGRGWLRTPHGLFQLAEPGLGLVGAGMTGGSGRGEAVLPIPPSPALIGTRIYWQAMVGASPLWTNLEITTLTNL